MAAVPIYVWNGTAWQETGPTIPASPIKYQASAPSSPSTGDIWVDSDGDVTSGSTQLVRYRFVASGGETSLSGNDANGATLAYTAGLEQVVLNGAVLVRGYDYTATNGTSITGLSPALVANDVVEVFSFMAFNVANTYTQSQVDGFVTSLGGTNTAWTSYTPTWTGLTVGNATQIVVYKQIGKTVIIRGQVTMGSTSSFGTDWTFSLPVTSKSFANNFVHFGTVEFRDAGTGVNYGTVGYSDQNNFYIFVLNSSTTYLSRSGISSTVPFTWTNGDSFSFYAIYEAA